MNELVLRGLWPKDGWGIIPIEIVYRFPVYPPGPIGLWPRDGWETGIEEVLLEGNGG